VTSTGRQLLILREISVVQDPPYYSPSAFVYVGEPPSSLGAIWDGVEAAERAGVSLAAIGRALSQDWEMSVIALARLGRRRL
jgi:hypothetical protein